jgi:hypothetical protein
MHISKRVALLCFLGLAALRSQAAAPEQPSATARKPQVNAPAMDADAERRARELLEQAMSGTPGGPATAATSAPPSVATAPPRVQGQQPAQQKPLREPREVVSGQPERAPSPSATELDLHREREIRRIEAEVDAARKRREAAAPTRQPAQPVAQTPVRPSPSPSPSSSPSTVTVVTDPRGLAVLQSQATPVLIGQPHAPASPAAATLTPEAEEKARELLRRNMMIIFNDYPTPQRTAPGNAALPGTQPSAPVSPNAALPAPTIRAEVPAPPPATAPLAGSTLTPSDEQRARELLHQIPSPGQAVAPAATAPVTVAPPASARNTGVQPPPPATLELPNGGAASVRPVAPVEPPKAQVVAPPATAVVPPTELPRPATPPAQPVISVPPVATPPPTVAVAPPAATLTPVTPPPSAYVPAVAPTTVPPGQGIGAGGLTAENEVKARQLVTQQVAEFRRSENIIPPAPAAPATPLVVPGTGSPEEVKATRELIKQQEREGKKRRAEEKRLEAEAKKQAERLDREGTTKAREEARRRLEAEAKARASGKTVSKPTSATTSGTPFKVTPGTKRQRLDQLTDAYVHDRIGAEEYHRERAKIVGEPGE